MESNVFIQLGVSLLLGLLVGLQRERTESAVAGIRTFPLITVFGTMCAWLATAHGGWVIAAGLMALAALLVVANLVRLKSGDIDPGLTTEIAALLLFGVGACVVIGQMAVAVALGGVIALLLQLKPMRNSSRPSAKRHQGYHAVRAGDAGDPARVAQSHVRPIRRPQSLQDLAVCRAHRGRQLVRLFDLQSRWS
jgi:hypothetical protein